MAKWTRDLHQEWIERVRNNDIPENSEVIQDIPDASTL